MFAPFPGFEEFELRVEVEWQGQIHIVLVRLEQAPAPFSGAVVACRFEGVSNDGEWLLLQRLSEPFRSTRQHNEIVLRRTVRNAFSGSGLTVGQFLELDVPCVPNRVLLTPTLSAWLADGSNHFVRSEQMCLFHWTLVASNGQKREALLNAWNDENSDVRFAWNWAQLSRDERMARLCGFSSNWGDLRRVMRSVLQCASLLWEHGRAWSWTLHREFNHHGWLFNPFDRRDTAFASHLRHWQEWLFGWFVPSLHTEWLERHVCAREFWSGAQSLESVRVDAPPTMHERLEARLELREWLQDKTTPSQIDKLLAI